MGPLYLVVAEPDSVVGVDETEDVVGAWLASWVVARHVEGMCQELTVESEMRLISECSVETEHVSTALQAVTSALKLTTGVD